MPDADQPIDLTTFPVAHPDHDDLGEVTADARTWPAMEEDGWKKLTKAEVAKRVAARKAAAEAEAKRLADEAAAAKKKAEDEAAKAASDKA